MVECATLPTALSLSIALERVPKSLTQRGRDMSKVTQHIQGLGACLLLSPKNPRCFWVVGVWGRCHETGGQRVLCNGGIKKGPQCSPL